MKLFRFCPFVCEFFCPLDVFVLGAFVATAKQKNDDVASLGVIDAVAWSEVDFHLYDARANAPGLAGISFFKAVDPREDFCPALSISQVDQPVSEFLRAKDFQNAGDRGP